MAKKANANIALEKYQKRLDKNEKNFINYYSCIDSV